MAEAFSSTAQGNRATSFVGILYAEDFDDPVAGGENEMPDAGPEPLPLITQSDVDAACAEAVRAAHREWQNSQEQSHRAAIAGMTTMLKAIRDTAESTALAAAEGTVTTILSMVQGLLPEFCREHGPAEVRALLGQLLPTIRSQERVCVRVHPDLVASIQHDVGKLEPSLAGIVDVVAGPVGRGDVTVTWENGSMIRDSRRLAQAVQDALSQLGLYQTIDAPIKRSMAYAD